MTLDTVDILGRMIVPAAVITALGLLRRYLPARKTDPQAQLDKHGDVEDFTRANVAVYAVMVLVGIGFAYESHLALIQANRHFAEADGPAAFRFFPSTAIWWFFPGFGALCLSWEITLFLWSVFGDRRRVSRFIDWTNENAGYDSTRALRWAALFVATPIGIASLLAIPLHSSLGENEIVVGHYATLGRQVLPYSQARRLLSVDGFRDRNGRLSQRVEIIIDFRDGTHWSSAFSGDPTPGVDSRLEYFLQQKTGLTPERAETEADLRTLQH